jgi:hypothetical protein
MKTIKLLLIGVLLLCISEVKSQRIEYDSTGIPHACTNYSFHKKESENKRIVQGLMFIGACVTVLAAEQAIFPEEKNNVNNLYRQMGYAGVAVIGAVVTVSLYKWNVKLQDKVGL